MLVSEFLNRLFYSVEIFLNMSDKNTPLPTDLLLKSVDVLNLTVRSRNALKRARTKTIYDILTLGEDKFIELPQVGKGQVDEVFSAIAQLFHVSREELFILTQFQKLGDTIPSQTNDATASLVEDRLPIFSEQILSHSVWALTQNIRSINTLSKLGIFTINDYLNAKEKNDLKNVSDLGFREINEIEEALKQIVVRTSSFQGELTSTQIRQIIYGDRTHIIDLELLSQTPINLIKLIIPFVRGLLSSDGESRPLQVLVALYNLDNHETFTLEDVGVAYGVSRERIRQQKNKALQQIRQALSGMKKMRKHVIPIELIQEVETVKQELSKLDPKLITEDQAINFFNVRYNMKISTKEINSLRFLLVILGYTELVTSAISVELVPSWQLNAQLDSNKIGEVIRVILSTLREKVRAVPFLKLKVEVNRKNKVDQDYVAYALKLLAQHVEHFAPDKYQLKFAKLNSVADQAYRVLEMFDKRTHYRDVVKEINHILRREGEKTSVNARTVTNQLAADSRFKSIGNSGFWALSEWDVVTDHIIKLIESFFYLKKCASTVTEIYEFVATQHPKVARNSIHTYLNSKEQFIRVSENKYELKEWGSKPYIPKEKPPVSQIIFNAYIDIFKNKRVQTLPLRELVLEIVEKTKVSEDVVYREIKNLKSFVLESDPQRGNRKLARIISDEAVWAIDRQQHEKVSKSQKDRITLMQTIFTEVDAYLQKQLRMRASLAQIVSHVIIKTKCDKQTVYGYISRMTHANLINKETIEGVTYCFIPQKSEVSTFNFTQIDRISTPELKSQINRAINLLNVDNVDLGLFELGKLLEKRLEAYLKTVRAKNIFPVSSNDLSRLVSMIDCVAQNGVIKNKHDLTYLREERNLRAHGEIPMVAEREDLMRKAELLANLYIDYIVLFEEKRQQIM